MVMKYPEGVHPFPPFMNGIFCLGLATLAGRLDQITGEPYLFSLASIVLCIFMSIFSTLTREERSYWWSNIAWGILGTAIGILVTR